MLKKNYSSSELKTSNAYPKVVMQEYCPKVVENDYGFVSKGARYDYD